MWFSARRYEQHCCVRFIAITAGSGNADQAGTVRAKAFASWSKALLISRILTTPIRVGDLVIGVVRPSAARAAEDCPDHQSYER
jgi:hypothetical protein